VKRLVAALVVALAVAGCSGGGGGPAPGPTQAPAASGATLAIGPASQEGKLVVAPLLVTVTGPNGSAITGPFSSPVTLTTSNAAHTGFSDTLAAATVTPSFNVSSSTQPVFFVYDGAPLTTPVTVSVAVANVPAVTYAFTPSAVPTPSSSASATPSAIKTLTIAENGAAPQIGSAGSFTLTVAAYDSNGTLITGTYLNPIVVTTNDTSDLVLASSSGNGSGGSATLTAGSQFVVVTYDGKPIPPGTTFSATALGVVSASTAFAPSAASSSKSASIKTISLSAVGPAPAQGEASQFSVNIVANDQNGNPISGAYPAPISISSSDAKDITFATTSAGPFASTVAIANSSTVVYANYDGAAVPQNAQIVGSAGDVAGTLAFTPAPLATTTLYIAKLTISTGGAAPQANASGAQPVYIAAFDQNGAPINGTYPEPVSISLNNNLEVGLSLGSYVAAVDCSASSSNCPNNAVVVVNSAGQTAFADYTSNWQNYMSQLSITAAGSGADPGVVCHAINFPLAQPSMAGSSPYTCQSQATTSKVRRPAATSLKLILTRK
jgi:hypothetical protein